MNKDEFISKVTEVAGALEWSCVPCDNGMNIEFKINSPMGEDFILTILHGDNAYRLVDDLRDYMDDFEPGIYAYCNFKSIVVDETVSGPHSSLRPIEDAKWIDDKIYDLYWELKESVPYVNLHRFRLVK